MLTTFSGRNASQDEYELTSFVEFLKSQGVMTYCEIGARHGDTFHSVMSSLPVGARGVAVDFPGALWGKKDTNIHLDKACKDLRAKGYEVDMLLGDSTRAKMIAQVAARGPYDAILIDGDHRYEGAKSDWNHYGPMGQIVAFHDIVGHDQTEKVYNNPVQVPRLWAEIKAGGAYTTEFVAPGSKMGIGVCISQ